MYILLYRTSITSLFQNGLQVLRSELTRWTFLVQEPQMIQQESKGEELSSFQRLFIILLFDLFSSSFCFIGFCVLVIACCFLFISRSISVAIADHDRCRWIASVASCSEGPPSRLKWCTNPKANMANSTETSRKQKKFQETEAKTWKHMDFSLISNFSQRIEHSISRTLTSKLFMTSWWPDSLW